MTWAAFRRQYNALGRDKADGYAPDDFAGMTQEELAQARDMMLRRALDGDTIDLHGLRLIGDGATVAALAAGDGGFGWSHDILRHEVLFVLTGDPCHLFALRRHIDGRDRAAQRRAAGVLAQYVLPDEAEAFLVDRIVDGRHDAALLPLLQAWIGRRRGIVCDIGCFQRHLELIRSIAGARPRHRRALLDAAAPSLREDRCG